MHNLLQNYMHKHLRF